MDDDMEIIWVCSTCGDEFTVEGNGRVHLDHYRHGVLYQRMRHKDINPSKRVEHDD